MLLEVAVRSPLRRLFTYESEEALPQGTRVRIPFGSREVMGVVWNESEKAPSGLKKILKVLDEKPFFSPRDLDFYQKASDYYGISLGELLSLSLPKKIQSGKALKEFPAKDFHFKLVKLSEAQTKVSEEVLSQKGFGEHLVLGETGSGKTEIYLKIFEKIVSEGGQCLFLVPEISLTPQFETRLRERIGTGVSLFHSQLKESLREETFSRARSGFPDIFLGTRSALFLPFSNLKIIIVDEEHDSSYKQSERGPYHARDLALWKAQLNQVPIVLGSATPSLETFIRAKEKPSPIHRLQPFYKSPSIEQKVIDLKALWKVETKSFISSDLQTALEENLIQGQQSLLFLNRRGTASQRLCTSCGFVTACRNCSTTLTVHRDRGVGICHWCGFQQKLSEPCTACGGQEFFEGGIGTKEVEAQVRARFPEARIARLDRDETAKKDILPETIEKFSKGELDILIGTQMISKGIDIPKLSLVGVILADQGWGVPDFRGLERSFQLLKQLKGRVGRRGQASKFLIQTFQPDHPIFEMLKIENAFENFANSEMEIRKIANLPPYSKMALWTVSHRDERVARESAEHLQAEVVRLSKPFGIESVGPSPAPLSRWKGVYRYQILTKADRKAPLTALLTALLDGIEKKPLKAKVKLDRDPYHFL